jgi:hypothetical protein
MARIRHRENKLRSIAFAANPNLGAVPSGVTWRVVGDGIDRHHRKRFSHPRADTQDRPGKAGNIAGTEAVGSFVGQAEG